MSVNLTPKQKRGAFSSEWYGSARAAKCGDDAFPQGETRFYADLGQLKSLLVGSDRDGSRRGRSDLDKDAR